MSLTVYYAGGRVAMRCGDCGDDFEVPRDWWFRRLESGASRLGCRCCDPGSYEGCPDVMA